MPQISMRSLKRKTKAKIVPNKLPSVTEILKLYQDFSGIPAERLEIATRRGSRVHTVCLAIAGGRWAPPLPEEYQGYEQSFRLWLDMNIIRVYKVEPEWMDEILGFIGHPDLIVQMKGDRKLTVVDLKTPTAQKRIWRMQLAGYGRLAETNGYKIEKVGTLRLKANGGFPIFDHFKDRAVALGAFVGALTARRYVDG